MKTYHVWQMKPEYFAELTLATFGLDVPRVFDESSGKEMYQINLSQYEKTYVTSREGGILKNLSQIYHELNQEDRPTGQISHSLSMGDVIEVENRYYRVGMMNFEEVSVD